MRTKTIQIPATIEEAVAQLGGLGQLLTAKGWERAAIVYAFTHDTPRGSVGRGRVRSEKSETYSLKEFADLKIHGLMSWATVQEHRENWKEAMANGWVEPVAPGDKVVLPTEPYPPSPRDGQGKRIGVHAPVEAKLKEVKRLAELDPAFAQALDQEYVEKVGKDATHFAKASRIHQEFFPKPDKPEPAVHEGGALKLASFLLAIQAYVDLRKPELQALRDYLHANQPLSALDRTSVQTGLDALDMALADLRLYRQVIQGELGGDIADLAEVFVRDQEGAH